MLLQSYTGGHFASVDFPTPMSPTELLRSYLKILESGLKVKP